MKIWQIQGSRPLWHGGQRHKFSALGWLDHKLLPSLQNRVVTTWFWKYSTMKVALALPLLNPSLLFYQKYAIFWPQNERLFISLPTWGKLHTNNIILGARIRKILHWNQGAYQHVNINHQSKNSQFLNHCHLQSSRPKHLWWLQHSPLWQRPKHQPHQKASNSLPTYSQQKYACHIQKWFIYHIIYKPNSNVPR